MHLSIQIKAQKQAEDMIHQWGEEAGIKIGDVRYHLLRNGLILQQVHLEREQDSLAIQHLFIRANPKLLTGTNPKIGRVEITGFDAVIWNPDSKAPWQNDQRLVRIWKATQSLTVSDASLTLHLKDELHPPIRLDAIFMQQQLQKKTRKISVTAQLSGAPVQWQWLSHDLPGEQIDWASKGEVRWQRVSVPLITNALGLVQTTGLLSGQSSWAIGNNGGTATQGKADLQDEAGTSISHQLSWSGNRDEEGWKLDVTAKAWPVQAWAESLPVFAGRTLSHALLDAELQWRQKDNNWSLSTPQANLNKVSYADSHQAESNQHEWTSESIHLNDLRLDFSKRKMDTTSITADHSSLIFQLKQDSAIGSHGTGGHGNNRHWDISADKIDINHMNLGLNTEHGTLLLPDLKGRCSWNLDNRLDFNLRSMKHYENSGIDKEQGSSEPEAWRIKGQAVYTRGNVKKSHFRLFGSHIDLARLRPIMPLQGAHETSLTLAGKSDLDINVTVSKGLWRAHGKASIDDAHLSYAGDTWKADQVKARFGPVGMGLDSQQMEMLYADGWSYSTALQPLGSYVPTSERANNPVASQVSWWKKDLRKSNWHIRQLQWDNGTVSIGNSDVNWAERLNIQIKELKPESWASVTANGWLGEGYASLDGKWYALADMQRFKGSASLDNGLPFFLHNWMLASGMPKLVRGRLSAALNIKDGEEKNSYESHVKLKLTRAVAEAAVSPNDPMAERTGYSTPGLLERLSDSNKIIAVDFENRGDWDKQPLNMHQLGLSLQQALHQAAIGKASSNRAGPVTNPSPVIGTRIRLRSEGRLSLNERIRLRATLRKMSEKQGWTIDLQPKWTGEKIDAETIKRIRHTQKLIQRFITHNKFPVAMVYPAWPTAKDHANEIGAIWVTLTPPAQKR